MLDKMTNQLNFHGNALVLRGERQRAIASNIANAVPQEPAPRTAMLLGLAVMV